MIRGTVILVEEKEALVLFEGQNIQKYVKIPRHITDLKKGDTVAVCFETQMHGGMIVGVE